MGADGQLRHVPKSSATMIFDPYAKRRTNTPHEVEEKNYRSAFTTYCETCMEKYGLHAGKLANRRVGECGICGKDGFLVGNMGAETDAIKMAQLCHFGDENQPGVDLPCQ